MKSFLHFVILLLEDVDVEVMVLFVGAYASLRVEKELFVAIFGGIYQWAFHQVYSYGNSLCLKSLKFVTGHA